MNELTQRLARALDHQEQIALAALAHHPPRGAPPGSVWTGCWFGDLHSYGLPDAWAEHAEIWDPHQVLSLIVAHREILAGHQPVKTSRYSWNHRDHLRRPAGGRACASCGVHDEYAVPWPCATLRALAAGYGIEAPEITYPAGPANQVGPGAAEEPSAAEQPQAVLPGYHLTQDGALPLSSRGRRWVLHAADGSVHVLDQTERLRLRLRGTGQPCRRDGVWWHVAWMTTGGEEPAGPIRVGTTVTFGGNDEWVDVTVLAIRPATREDPSPYEVGPRPHHQTPDAPVRLPARALDPERNPGQGTDADDEGGGQR